MHSVTAPEAVDTLAPVRLVPLPSRGKLIQVLGVSFGIAGSVVSDWSNSWKSLLLLALSYPLYRFVAARRDRAAAH